jgi:hypothetical protein
MTASPEVTQVPSLPMSGSGAAQFNNILVDVVSTNVQGVASSKYDPKVQTEGVVTIHPEIEGFCSSSSSMIMVIGVLCIVYGVIAK